MQIEVIRTELAEIRDMREMFLQENRFQFICNKCHDYGWSDDYLILLNGVKTGYGCVWGTDRREDRDTIFEFYLLKPYRYRATEIFARFCTETSPVYIEAQSNDRLHSSLLFEFSKSIVPEAILFEDDHETGLSIPDVHFSRKNAGNNPADAGGYVLEYNGETVATGGFMLNYNKPYADIYMEVYEKHRGNGYGALIVQELKKEAYRLQRVPAARCNIHNRVSKAALLKAGFRVCGARLKGMC